MSWLLWGNKPGCSRRRNTSQKSRWSLYHLLYRPRVPEQDWWDQQVQTSRDQKARWDAKSAPGKLQELRLSREQGWIQLLLQHHPKKEPTAQQSLNRAPGNMGRGVRGVPGEAGQGQQTLIVPWGPRHWTSSCQVNATSEEANKGLREESLGRKLLGVHVTWTSGDLK